MKVWILITSARSYIFVVNNDNRWNWEVSCSPLKWQYKHSAISKILMTSAAGYILSEKLQELQQKSAMEPAWITLLKPKVLRILRTSAISTISNKWEYKYKDISNSLPTDLMGVRILTTSATN